MTVSLARLIAADADVPAGAASIAIKGLSADSREVKPGFLFAALPGTAVDGAEFIAKAVAAGAVAVLASRGVTGAGVPVVAVDNPRQVFARMAARFFGRRLGKHILSAHRLYTLS